MLHGGRASLVIGLFSAALSVVLGMTIGMLAGFFGGTLDEVLMRITEAFQILPKLLVAVVVVAMIGSGLANEVLVIGLLSWPGTARVIRGRVQVIRHEEFIAAAEMSGASWPRVLVRHVAPNVVAFLLVSASLQVASAIMAESFLSFLGLGDPAHPELGPAASAGPALPQRRLVAHYLPRHRARHDHPRAEPPGRRPAMTPVLSVRDLRVSFPAATVVDGVSFDVMPAEIVGVVGESGSGKSMTAKSVLRLLPKTARLTGSVRFRGDEVLAMSPAEIRAMRGALVSMVFQDPMTSFNPVLRIGDQIAEAMALHGKVDGRTLRERTWSLLGSVGIANPAQRAKAYPHEFSGGMRQRALTAMAVANGPALLIADEPTTALDVTVQDQILQLMRDLNEKSGTAILLITHNIAVVASLCRRLIVMYAGRVVEDGPTAEAADRAAPSLHAGRCCSRCHGSTVPPTAWSRSRAGRPIPPHRPTAAVSIRAARGRKTAAPRPSRRSTRSARATTCAAS